MEFDRQKFAQRLRAARRQAGLSQERLAHQCGLTVGAYRRLEKGTTSPHAATIYALAQVLGLSADWLLGLRDDGVITEH